MKKLLFLSVVLLSSYSILAVSKTEKDILARLDSIENRLDRLENKLEKASAGKEEAPSKELVEIDGITKIHTKAQLDKILSEPGAKIFKFTTKDCQFCPAMEQPFAEAAQEYKGRVKAYAIDGYNKELRAYVRENVVDGFPTVTSIPKQNPICGARTTERYKEFFAKAARMTGKAK